MVHNSARCFIKKSWWNYQIFFIVSERQLKALFELQQCNMKNMKQWKNMNKLWTFQKLSIGTKWERNGKNLNFRNHSLLQFFFLEGSHAKSFQFENEKIKLDMLIHSMFQHDWKLCLVGKGWAHQKRLNLKIFKTKFEKWRVTICCCSSVVCKSHCIFFRLKAFLHLLFLPAKDKNMNH